MIKHKPKRCKICPTMFTPYNSMIKHCSPDCAIEILKIEQAKKHRKEKAEYRIRTKPIAKWIAEAQAIGNLYARLRDYYDPCISCGASKEDIESKQGWKTGGCWDGGHFQGRGKKPQLRFNLLNINKECKSCNGGSGKFSHKEATTSAKYKANLILKIGAEKVEYLETYNESRKWDREYCEKFKRVFTKKVNLQRKRLGID